MVRMTDNNKNLYIHWHSQCVYTVHQLKAHYTYIGFALSVSFH